MQHFSLFYLLLTLATGSVSWTLAAYIYLKTRDTFVRSYLVFYTAFTLLVVSEAFTEYVRVNIPQWNAGPIGFWAASIPFFMIFAAGVFIHDMFAVPQAHLRNAIIGSIAGFMLGQHLLLGYLQTVRHWQMQLNWWGYVTGGVGALLSLYIVILSLYYARKSEGSLNNKLIFDKGMIGCILSFPATLLDTFWRSSFPLRLFPLFYCFLSITFTRHFLKYTLPHTLLSPEVPPVPANPVASPTPAVSEVELFAQYDISPREQEILRLMLQGYSYQKVGDTLYISLNTVKTHISNIYAKCGVKNRYELIRLFQDTQ